MPEHIRRREPAHDIERARDARTAKEPHRTGRLRCNACGHGADGKVMVVYPDGVDPATLECSQCGACDSTVTPAALELGPPG